MMAEPEEFAEAEKGKNRVRSEVTGDCDTVTSCFDPLILLCFPHFTGKDNASD
jgi:hypothetical protein